MQKRGLGVFHSASLVVFFIILIIGAYIYSLARVSASDLRIVSVQDVSANGATIKSAITLTNGGIVPVTVNSVPYTVTLDQTGEVLANDTLSTFSIDPGSVRVVPVEVDLVWKGLSADALKVIADKSATATLHASVRVSIFGVIIPIPIEAPIRVGDVLKGSESTSTASLDARNAVKGLLG